MKKILIILIATASVVFAADEAFVLSTYKPNTTAKYEITNKKVSDNFSIPEINGDDITTRKIERTLSNFQTLYYKPNTKVSYEVMTNNGSILSILFIVESSTINYVTYTFNVNDGNLIQLSDLMYPGFNKALTQIIVDRARQFGLHIKDGVKDISDKGKYVITNNIVLFVFNENELTDTGDKIAFIPFFIEQLQGIIK